MNQNFAKAIGIRNESTKDAYLFYVNQVKGLKDIFSKDFNEWSNFDNWESILV